MSATLLFWSLFIAQILLALAMAAAVFRMIKGPRAQDRVLSVDSLYVAAMLMTVVFGIRSGVSTYFEAALIIGVLGFASSVALAKFLMRGEVIE